jgi:isoquinoline 1-oxidoreductase alpha subunit
MATTLTINGEPKSFDAPADMPLLWVLRDILGLTGTKFGCGIAQCGACTVHVDGKPVRSCMLPVGLVQNRAVTTIEVAGNICRCGTYVRIRAAIKKAASQRQS